MDRTQDDHNQYDDDGNLCEVSACITGLAWGHAHLYRWCTAPVHFWAK
jgi:hypothetical protein